MSKTEGKPVHLTTIDPFKHDGNHYAVGDVLPGMDPELAKELTGAGRTRLATEDEMAPKKGKPSSTP